MSAIIKKEDGTAISPAEIVAGDKLTLVRVGGSEVSFTAQFSSKTPSDRAALAAARTPGTEGGRHQASLAARQIARSARVAQSSVTARAERAAANSTARAAALPNKGVKR